MGTPLKVHFAPLILSLTSESNGKERLNFLKKRVQSGLSGKSVEWIFSNTVSQRVLDSGERILDKRRPTAALSLPVVIGHASLPIATLWLPVVITHEALPIAMLCAPVVMDFGFNQENLVCKSANEVEETHRKKKTT